MKSSPIRFFDLIPRLEARRDEYSSALLGILETGKFVLGDAVETFESEFSKYLGGGFSVGVANGSDGLEIAIAALGLESGSLVGTVANAGGYTSIGIQKNRMSPIYMDVNLESRNVQVAEVERVLDSGAKAIVLTHLYGNLNQDVQEIVNLCRDRGAYVVEDASQAHGAHLNGIFAGRFGDISVFSLYPTKNLGALGDAGIIVVNNAKFEMVTRQLRTYGWSEKYNISIPNGRNSRLDDFQAAVLSVNLKFLDQDNNARIEAAKEYLSHIKNSRISLPTFYEKSHVFHLFTILTEDRVGLIQHLKLQNIESAIHFPLPDYRQIGLSVLGINLPNTEYLCSNILSIPCYPELDKDSLARTVQVINNFL
jgi:dTDP-4-amino-4,6-dideoxygalactose transaminase